MIKLDNNSSDFDLMGIIIEVIITLVICLIISIIVFALTMGTARGSLLYGYNTGISWISFIVGVFLSSGFIGFLKDDTIHAAIYGFIIGLLTSWLEYSTISLIWGQQIAYFYTYLWGSQSLILIVVGVISAVGVNIFLSIVVCKTKANNHTMHMGL